MKFLDEIKIFIKSGDGGSGCCSFRREKFIEYGGPDGGNGGKGGDVIVKCLNSLNTLIDYKYKQHCIAKNGKPGMKKNKTGKNGTDLIINLPVGTEILINASGFLAANPDAAIQSIRKEVAKAAKEIAATKDPSKISILNTDKDAISYLLE